METPQSREGKPLPDGLAPLPDGVEYLGAGGEFTLPAGNGWFQGFHTTMDHLTWVPGVWSGRGTGDYYAADTDSAIAKLNREGVQP